MDKVDCGSRILLASYNPKVGASNRSRPVAAAGQCQSLVSLEEPSQKQLKKRTHSYSLSTSTNCVPSGYDTFLQEYRQLKQQQLQNDTRSNGLVVQVLINLLSGLIAFLLSSTIAVSCASVVVGHGTLMAEHVSNIIDMNFLGTAVLCSFLAWQSTAPWAIGAIDVFVAPIMGEMAQAISKHLHHDMEVVIPSVIVMVSITSFLLGLALYVMGRFRVTSLANYMPFPVDCLDAVIVIAGFLAGVGAQLLKNGFHMAVGREISVHIFSTKEFSKALPSFLLAGLSRFSQYKKWQVYISFPILLAISVVSFHLIAYMNGYTIHELKKHGWIFSWSSKILKKTPMWYSWYEIDFSKVHWHSLLIESSGYFITLLLLGGLKYSVFVSSFSTVFQRNISPDKEMKVIGLANLLAGAMGCNGGCHYLSAMGMLAKFGALERAPAVLTSLLYIIIWTCGFKVLIFIPKFVFGGLLMDVGIHFLEAYFVAPIRIISHLETAIILSIILSFLTLGMLQSVGLGILISVFVLVYRIHSIGCIRHETTGSLSRSIIDRNVDQTSFLDMHGNCIHILRLQGFLFFGTSISILECVEKRLSSIDFPPLQYLIIDFALVPNFDATALHHFRKLSNLAEANDFTLFFSDMKSKVHRALLRIPKSSCVEFILFGGVEKALEICEDRLLTTYGHIIPCESHDVHNSSILVLWEEFLLMEQNQKLVEHLLPLAVYLEICVLTKDEYLDCKFANDTFFICSGFLNIFEFLHESNENPISSQLQNDSRTENSNEALHAGAVRIRKAGPGSIICTDSLGVNRKCEYVAESNCILLCLYEPSMITIEDSSPHLALGLLRLLNRKLLLRYQQSNKKISQLSNFLFSDRHSQL